MVVERTRTTAQATAEGLRVFVAGIPWKIGEETLRRDFEECGVIEDLFLMRDADGNSKGRCFITFQEKTAADAALLHDSTEYGGRKIFVKLAEAKEKKSSETVKRPNFEKKEDREHPHEKPEGCRSLCLKNLGEAEEDDIRKFLRGCEIQSVRIVIDRLTGRTRGIAFVDFRSADEVDKAMKVNGEELDGRVVEMYYEAPRSRPRPEGCMTVALKKLPENTREKDILKLFKGLNSLKDVRVITNKDAKTCNGLAFAEFNDVKDVEAAVQRDGMKIRGSIIFVCFESKVKEGAGTKDNRKKLFLKEALETGSVIKHKKTKKRKQCESGDGEENCEKEDGSTDAVQPVKKKKKKSAKVGADTDKVTEGTPETSEQPATATQSMKKKKKTAKIEIETEIATETTSKVAKPRKKKKNLA